ncbi:MAG TPA: hypothetical protein ENN53_04175 [Candidatus Acetothermia bacterium]|nr:hypothetical protein [Candidatus Acetothermia bacterium]
MDPRLLNEVRGFCLGLLRVVGERGEAVARAEGEGVYVDLRGEFRHLPTGDPLFRSALARVARLHLKSHHGQDVPVLVDINGEAVAHREELARRARELARQALAENRRIELAPMPPDDRRTVHLALADFPGVRTFSVGREQGRRVVIEPDVD